MAWIMDCGICLTDEASNLLGYWTRTDKSTMRMDHGLKHKTIIIYIIVCHILTCLFCYLIWSLRFKLQCLSFVSLCTCSSHNPHFSTCILSFDNQLTLFHLPVLCNTFSTPVSKVFYTPLLIDNILTCLVICYTVFYTWLINIHPTIIVIFWSTCLDKIPGFISNGFTPQFSILENFANYAVMYSVTYDTCIIRLTCSALYLAVFKPYDSEVKQFCIIFLIAVLIFNDLRFFLRYLVWPFYAFAVLDFRPLCMCNMWFQLYHIFALTSFRPCYFLPFYPWNLPTRLFRLHIRYSNLLVLPLIVSHPSCFGLFITFHNGSENNKFKCKWI